MNYKLYQTNTQSIDLSKVKQTAANLKINEKLVELLFLRGICDEKSINAFIHPSVDNFYDPYLMKGMKQATQRIQQAIDNKERIVVYGDYDADGICATAILTLFLSSRGLDVYSHIPNRIGEGYGLNCDSLEKIIENVNPDLILTCDCGISGIKEVEFVLDLGVDIIVTDHHEVGETVPECIVVNPKQTDCNYPYSMLCGAGVALKLVQAMGGLEESSKYYDLACVATIADLMPLTDENRLIVQLGLKKIQTNCNLGLKRLLDDQKLTKPMASDIAYRVAPRINAAGRMGDAYRAFELVTTRDIVRIDEIIQEINIDNNRRKEVCNQLYNEAISMLADEDMVNNRAIVLTHPNWEKGITGIVAARLSGDFHRPSFILVNAGDTYKGTCRSIEGINIYDLLLNVSPLLTEFGGHSQAAGFSIKEENIPEFKKQVNEYLRSFDSELFMPKCSYDMELTLEDINYDFVMALELLEPTGNSNCKPLFRLDVNDLVINNCKNNINHISILAKGLQIFAFNYLNKSYELLGSNNKSLVVELQPSNYGGRVVKGIMRAVVSQQLYINDNIANGYEFYLSTLPLGEHKAIEYDNLDDILPSNLYGTLVIASTRADYNNFMNKYNYRFSEFMYPLCENNYSKIIVAPEMYENNFSIYDRVVFLSRPINNGILHLLSQYKNTNVYIPKTTNNKLYTNLDTSREVFAEVFNKIRNRMSVEADTLHAYFKVMFPKQDITYRQFAFCVSVFNELGIFDIKNQPFSIKIDKSVKAELDKSSIYQKAKSYKEEN